MMMEYHEEMLKKAKEAYKKTFTPDKLIVQAIQTYESLTKMANLLYERLTEWVGLYWPEKVRETEEMEEFAQVDLKERPKESIGYDLSEEDVKMLDELLSLLREILKYRKRIADYIEKRMETFAPNLLHVAGPLIGAKLIALAGSLKQLALFPSSTIQVLGAEKALFRHLKFGAKPPKHGILFQHPLVKKAKKKGKVARVLAAKISIAARVDYYSKGKELIWEKLIEEIKAKL